MKILFFFFVLCSFLVPSLVSAQKEDIQHDTFNAVIIYQVKTEDTSQDDEYVLLFNQSENVVNISGWCLSYTTAGDNPSTVFSKECVAGNFLLAPGEFASFGTAAFTTRTKQVVDFSFKGGMVSSGGHLRLLDATKKEVDKVGWGTATNPEKISSLSAPIRHAKSQALSRSTGILPLDSDDNLTDFISALVIYQCPGTQFILSSEYYVDELGNCLPRFCPNLLDSETEAPDDFYKPEGEKNCVPIPVRLEDSVLSITELYPNAPSTDKDNEFIELYNPNNTAVSLIGYVLQIGPDFTKSVVLDTGELTANEYRALSDSKTGIVLPNITGVVLRLVSPAGTIVSETALYSDAQENETWALINDAWQWTNQSTPNKENNPSLEIVAPVGNDDEELMPCPVGKFRNPETNRCKNIEVTTAQLQPCELGEIRNPETNRCRKITSVAGALSLCKLGQVRNPETNRCRNITSTTSTLTPCKPGQERNPETNRCRSIAAATSTLKPCAEGQERNLETNRCRKVTSFGESMVLGAVADVPIESTEGQINWIVIIVTLTATASYMLYEWRVEIAQKIRIFKLTRG